MRCLALILTAWATAASVPATAQDLSGSWEVTWAQAVRYNRDGTSEVQRWGKARLTLTQAGDSVRGHWRADAGGVTWQVAGRVRDGVLRLSATERDSDDPELAMVERMEWEAMVEKDELRGSVWMVIPRLGREPRKRPWAGVRGSGSR